MATPISGPAEPWSRATATPVPDVRAQSTPIHRARTLPLQTRDWGLLKMECEQKEKLIKNQKKNRGKYKTAGAMINGHVISHCKLSWIRMKVAAVQPRPVSWTCYQVAPLLVFFFFFLFWWSNSQLCQVSAAFVITSGKPTLSPVVKNVCKLFIVLAHSLSLCLSFPVPLFSDSDSCTSFAPTLRLHGNSCSSFCSHFSFYLCPNFSWLMALDSSLE